MKKKEINNNEINNVDESNFINKRTLLVGSSFSGKTYLLLNQFQLFRLDNPEQQIKFLSRSPEQYSNTALLAFGTELDDVSVEEGLEDRTIQDFFKIVVLYLMICWIVIRNY